MITTLVLLENGMEVICEEFETAPVVGDILVVSNESITKYHGTDEVFGPSEDAYRFFKVTYRGFIGWELSVIVEGFSKDYYENVGELEAARAILGDG